MHHFILHIFPDTSLASSLITTVWIGVFVTCFFNLRYGWNKSGLIVPGYLVPLIILKPWSAFAVIIEALVTYLVVKFVSEFGSFSKLWSNYFGRDRFFLIFIFAILVRIIFDRLLFPELAQFLSSYFNIEFVYFGGLYSIGLVIVSLVANQFWTSGFKRGFPHLMVTLFITYLIIRYILIEYTNFSLNEVVYLYEDIATSIAASPKAYIILTVTAFIASRMNLLYGWEFSGIIIPALLALQWYYPWKILTSIIEAGIIYGIATIILRSKFFLNSTIEGGRKILLFFNIAFFYKMLLGFFVPIIFPALVTTDTFGLGYMLTSLIAIKMYDKKVGLKMTRSILQASIIAIIFATLIGFVLLYTPNPFLEYKFHPKRSKNKAYPGKIAQIKDSEFINTVEEEQIKLYGKLSYTRRILDANSVFFKNALISLDYYINTRSVSSLQYAVKNLKKVYYKITFIGDNILMLSSTSRIHTGGLFLLSLKKNAKDAVISIPLAINNPALISCAANFFQKLNVKALAINGNTFDKNYREIFRDNNSFFYHFLKEMSTGRNTLTALPKNEELASLLKLDEDKNSKTEVFSIYNYPTVLDRSGLIDIAYHPYPKNLSRLHILDSSYGIALIPDKDIIKLLSTIKEYSSFKNNKIQEILPEADAILITNKKKKEKDIFGYIFGSSSKKVKHNSYATQKLTLGEGAFLDQNILTPLLDITAFSKLSYTSKDFLNTTKIIDFCADNFGWNLSLYSVNKKPKYIILNRSPDSKKEKIPGAYFFRIDNGKPYILQIFDTAASELFNLTQLLSNKFNPSVMMFAISPYTDLDYSSLADFTVPKKSIFNLTNQVVIREYDNFMSEMPYKKREKAKEPTVIQVRTLKNTKDFKYPEDTIYFATYHGKYKYNQLTDQEKEIFNFLKKSGFKVKLADNASPETAGMEAIRLEQARYLSSTLYVNFIALWLSPDVNIFKKKKNK